ncbi:MAG: APC family permease [Acidobacteriota bacterium]
MAASDLRRSVSRWQVVGLSINDVVGSGIYLLPAAAAAYLGSASLWAVALAGLTVLLMVLCFSEAATYFEGTGGAYLYTRAAFGDFVGFEVGWMTWLARVASIASLSVGFAQAVCYLWPAAAAGTSLRPLVIVVPLLVLTYLNWIGVGSGARTAVVLVIAKLVPLAVFVAAGIFAFSRQTFSAQASTGPTELGNAALLLLFAYAGFENTTAPAGEYRQPRRDIPFALITQITFVTLLYCAVQAVALGTLPEVARSETPLADAAGLFLGSWGGILLTFGAAVSILGTNGNSVLAGPRYLFALSRHGYGPRALASVHPRYRTPGKALWLQTAIALPLALSGSFTGLAALSIIARLTGYFGTAVAIPVLRRRQASPDGSFRIPGGLIVPVLAALLALGLAASAGRKNLLAGAIALAVGAAIYALRRPVEERLED